MGLVESMEFRRFLSFSTRKSKFDLVIGSFVLSDLPDDGVRRLTIESLWEHTNDILVIHFLFRTN